jgi:hypothetical protein
VIRLGFDFFGNSTSSSYTRYTYTGRRIQRAP